MTKKEIKTMNDSELVAAFYEKATSSIIKTYNGYGIKGITKEISDILDEMTLRFNLDRHHLLKVIGY